MTETIDISALPKGHPVTIYSEEKELIQKLGNELLQLLRRPKIRNSTIFLISFSRSREGLSVRKISYFRC